MRADVVVVGGGIAGASVAYALATAGAATILVDRHDHGRATDAGAGILSPETSGNPLDGWWELVQAAGDHYRSVVTDLARAGADDTGYAVCGLLAVALADWDVTTYETVARLALERDARSGAGLHEIPVEEAAARFPVGAPMTRVLCNPAAARVDGRKMTAALLAVACERGLVVVDDAVTAVSPSQTGARVQTNAGATIDCGAVVVAGGAWTPELATPLGVRVMVRPERGQIVHLDVDGWDTGAWPIIQPAFGFYLVAWPGGRVVVGATREPRAGFDARPTVAGLRQILDEVARLAPGLGDAPVAEVRVGLRPVSQDDLPILGPLPTAPSVHLATGYGANGLLLAPWCGHLVAAGVLGQAPTALDRFRPDRFS